MMEMTWEEWKAMKKGLRRHLGATGWILVVYYIILNVSVFLWTFAETLIKSVQYILSGDFNAMEQVMYTAAESGWGYFLAALIGFVILLIWKKPRFWREQIWAKGKPMKCGTFFGILCVFLGGQLLSQVMLVGLELILNLFGLTIVEGVEALSVDPDNFSLFLYASLLAPISEEILFRGLIQRSLMPFGKRFAIFCSAFTFGLFHGNLIQTPYAFVVGLVLGYVAAEYSIGWAMLLHMINNLLIADSLNRLTSGLTEEAAAIVIWAVLLFFGVAAIVVLISRRRNIRLWREQETINKTYLGCFFASACMIVFVVMMTIMMVVSLYLMITPISM